jgi:predicted nucleotidyltransferase
MSIRDCSSLRERKFFRSLRVTARVFESVARGTARRGSDVDFLIEMEEGRSLLDHAALILDLERLLKAPVAVASERGLRQPLRKEVLLARIIHDGSSRNRAVATRDRRAEP